MNKQADPMSRALSVELYGYLSEPMPNEALHDESSRGFTMTSIRAGFVIERLNQVFGLLGYGWRYARGPYRVEGDEVLVTVCVQWRVTEGDDHQYCHPVNWSHRVDEDGTISEGWLADTDLPAVWSEPVVATGGSSLNRKGSLKVTDAHRGAVTNGITKAASRLGVGIEIWKGENDQTSPDDNARQQGQGKRPKTKTKAPARAKAKTPQKATNAPANGEQIVTLTGIRKQAQVELDKLTCEDRKAEAKDLQSLARLMAKLEIEMQAVKLIHLLYGEGELSLRRIMATNNLLSDWDPKGTRVDMINSAAWLEKEA